MVGLSMGGALASALAAGRADLAGLVVINPTVQPSDEMRAKVEETLAAGEEYLPGIGSDIADPDSTEVARPHARPVAAHLVRRSRQVR